MTLTAPPRMRSRVRPLLAAGLAAWLVAPTGARQGPPSWPWAPRTRAATRSSSFFAEEDRVLFSGDVAMPALPALISPSSSVRVWLQALETLSGLRPSRVVPSHGDMGDARMIDDYRRFLETVQRRVRECVGAKEAEERRG